METGFTSCNGVFSKAQGLGYSKLCLNPDISTGMKEPEHEEKYITTKENRKKCYRDTLRERALIVRKTKVAITEA